MTPKILTTLKTYDAATFRADCLAGIVVAMVGARSAAMGFNRLADRRIDAENPRTADRALPAGLVTPAFVSVYVVASLTLLVVAAWRLNPLALKLSPVAVLVVLAPKEEFSWQQPRE